MEAIQGAIGLSPSNVVPRGLGTAELESFSGYAARISAKIAVPPLVFVRRALEDAAGGPVLNTSVTAGARRLNVGDRGPGIAAAVGRLTGHPDLGRLSYFAFTKLLGVGERGLLSRRRRWCSDCWRADLPEPYERKIWWLGLVDVCPVHGCLLESRCQTCGRLQPPLPRAVRLQVCSYCGHDLLADPVVGSGPAFDRMLWYAREGAHLVHAGEAIALSGSDERESLREAYVRFADLARRRRLQGVERFFAEEIQRTNESKLEALMSGLWRLQVSILDLFSSGVRDMLRGC